jgi:hypothetical protein
LVSRLWSHHQSKSTSNGSIHKYYSEVSVTGSYKHSSLQWKGVNYDRKSFTVEVLSRFESDIWSKINKSIDLSDLPTSLIKSQYYEGCYISDSASIEIASDIKIVKFIIVTIFEVIGGGWRWNFSSVNLILPNELSIPLKKEK